VVNTTTASYRVEVVAAIDDGDRLFSRFPGRAAPRRAYAHPRSLDALAQ
jgi:hypothetical protein